MKKELFLLIVITLVAGALVTTIVGNANNRGGDNQQAAAPEALVDHQQNIEMLVEIVQKEPENRGAWVQLGHNYFDTQQPIKAIEAYDKALALDGNDPDVLTDQGVMFRRIGWFDKAIDNFTKANELDPQHLNSLFNLGIVYNQDLGDKLKAEDAWTRYLQLSPTGQMADRVRTLIDHMKNGHE